MKAARWVAAGHHQVAIPFALVETGAGAMVAPADLDQSESASAPVASIDPCWELLRVVRHQHAE